MMKHPLLTGALLAVLVSAGVHAQEATNLLPGRPDRDISANAVPLAEAFESVSGGISIRPPQGGKMIRRPGEAEIVRWVYEQPSGAFLSVTSTSLKRPASLTTADLENAPDPGMLEMAAAELKRVYPGVQIVRNDTTNVADQAVGMLAARYTVGTTSYLSQQAIVQGSEQSYYTINYVTPGAKPNTPLDAEPEPQEIAAVETFAAVLDSVQLLDRTNIKVDQDQRLYRTRALFVNLTQTRMDALLIPEQWFRIQKNGKDIGYLYTVEETTKLGGSPAVKIGIRSRQFDEKKRRIDAEAWLYMTIDRKHEKWSRVSVVTDGKEQAHGTEIGASDLATKAVLDTATGGRPQIGEKQRFREVDEYPLTVKYAGKTGEPEPITRMLPPWYLPQALGQLLPRAVPRTERKGYLFATYVPDRREVMMRYVDVLDERLLTFAGQSVRATPIEDKIGVDGYVTTHYLSENSVYLGSETKYPDTDGNDVKITFIASTATELTKLWDANAELSRPVEGPVQVEGPKDR